MSKRAAKLIEFLEVECGWECSSEGSQRECENCGSIFFNSNYTYCPDCGTRLPFVDPYDQSLEQVEEGIQRALGE